MRKSGFYWVHTVNKWEDMWEVARWEKVPGPGYWYLTGYDMDFTDSAFAEIDEKELVK
jgi:hypothetical protein